MSDHRTGEIRGYNAVRAAARDFETYSSDIQGDRDVRVYQQFPLEVDPPRHALFRDAIQPYFMSDAIKPHFPAFKSLAADLIAGIASRGHGDLVTDLAIPYVLGCLGIVFNRNQDVAEWISWGPDVWLAEAHQRGEVTADSYRASRERAYDKPSQRSGTVLDSYIKRVVEESFQHPEREPVDMWDRVTRIRVGDRAVTRGEMHGIASIILAGGRDSVIKLITGLAWHLSNYPKDREFLTANPSSANTVVAELLRYLSPLPKMERRVARDAGTRTVGDYVLISFVSANHDPEIFPNPGAIDIHRERRPHVAFGFGRHSCVGMNLTEHEAEAFLEAFTEGWPGWQLADGAVIEWAEEGAGDDLTLVLDRFDSVPVTMDSH
jgi:cytochrome P450